jgi:hypothetical protein
MTCRIRAGEVARPPDAASPQGLLGTDRVSVPATRRARVLHSCRSTPVDRSSGRRQDSASARTAPPPVAGAVGRDLHPRKSENPNGTGGLCCYSPLRRSGEHPLFQAVSRTGRRSGPAPERLVPLDVHPGRATGPVPRATCVYPKGGSPSGPSRGGGAGRGGAYGRRRPAAHAVEGPQPWKAGRSPVFQGRGELRVRPRRTRTRPRPPLFRGAGNCATSHGALAPALPPIPARARARAAPASHG